MTYDAPHNISFMELGQIYFWTATINNWRQLLSKEHYKDIIINSLGYLTTIGKIDVFAFVIMPNHIHLIWRMNEMNGKEMPQGSFLKYTAHQLRRNLLLENPLELNLYAVEAHNKRHEFWQLNPLAIHLYTREIAYQKLDYLHWNPTAKHWQLVEDYINYAYSSVRFYEFSSKEYSFLKDLREEF